MTQIINRIRPEGQSDSLPRKSLISYLRHQRAIFFLFLALPGCGEVAARLPEPTEAVPVVAMGTAHDPSQCGKLEGAVEWTGEIPVVPMMTANTQAGPKLVPNPHAPAIDTKSRGMAGVVVYLRGVDPAKAMPWTRPNAVTVSASELGLQVEESGRYGFVPHGGEIRIQSVDINHSVRGRGALSFAMPLPDANVVSSRTATRPGWIHVSSGSNIAWGSAHLFVCENPYYAVTDTSGKFTFDAVPAGKYELVAWHPNWSIVGHDRNPETGLICRFHYDHHLTQSRPIAISANTTVKMKLQLTAAEPLFP
jgi:hypothetical protein